MKRTAQNDEFLKKRKARQRRIRRRRMLIGLTLLIVLLIVAGAALSLTVFFPIESLSAKGSAKYTSEQIIAASGINKGDNLFTASVKLDELREKLPYIESVKLKRNLPGSLTITVADAEAYACYYTDNKYFLVSKSGYVLENPDEKPNELTLITASGVKCELGKRVEFSDEKTQTLITEIGKYAGEYGVTLNSIDITDELSLTVKAENRFTVNLGTSNYLENKFAHLSGMIKNIEEGKTGKINLSMWTSDNTEGTFVAGSIE
ncbi:MAG: cell division protein FtsQ/DivIB [Acutalibacteraceae bacterium]